MLRKIFLAAFLIFSSASLFAQTELTNIRELKIGDTLSRDIVIHNILSTDHTSVTLGDLYKNGLLIINFWATWCGPCLEELPVLDSMKAKFPNQINVLAVAYQDRAAVMKYLNKRRPNLNLLKITVGDTLLSKEIFPHRWLPHNVWIDKNGVVREMTDEYEITPANIRKFLSNSGSMRLPVKIDNMHFNMFKPYHVEDSMIQYRSIISSYNGGINSGVVGGTGENNDLSLIKRFFSFNRSIIDLYYSAYGFSTFSNVAAFINYKLIEVHTKDSARLFYPGWKNMFAKITNHKAQEEWERKNLYCYDLILPHPVKNTAFSKDMFDDLERFFNITGKIEKRNVICWAVTIDSAKLAPFIHKADTSKRPRILLTGKGLQVWNTNLDQILYRIYDRFFGINAGGPEPFVNETGIKGPIDINLSFGYLSNENWNLKNIMTQLESYGFQFKKEVQPFPVLVLYDHNN